MTEIKEFDAVRVKNVALQYSDGTETDMFECMGAIEGETEMRKIVKRCGGTTLKSISRPIEHNLVLNGFAPVSAIRNIFGISNKDLKEGVYSYGVDSKGKTFCLTADVIDEFEDITKVMAFPNSNSASGFRFTVDNDADELAYVELEFDVNPDEVGQFLYEAFVDEIDEEVKSEWHTGFSRELVEAIEA